MSFQRKLQVIGIALFSLGAFGLAFSFLSLYGLISPRDVEFPLSGISEVAVDSTGRIYCGAQFYARVQQYTSEGVFRRGWSVDTGGGQFRLRVDNRDRIVVTPVRRRRVLVYNSEGVLLEIDSPDTPTSIAEESDQSRSSASSLRIEHGLLWPQVIRTGPSDEERVIIDTDVVRWIIMAPLPASFFLFGSGIPISLARRLRSARKQRTQPPR
jgi:hypothetical protein